MKRNLLWVVLILFSVGVLGFAAQADETDVTLRMGSSNLMTTLDPHGQYSPTTGRFLYFVHDSLLFLDGDKNLQPSLATDYNISEDGRRITMNLRDDVVFSDGSPFNAEAVQFTFERAQQIGQRSNIFSTVMAMASIEVVDEYTVAFNLYAPAAHVLTMLGHPGSSILSPSAVAAGGENYGLNPVGTGPFVVSEFQPGEFIRLEVNPNYGGHRGWEAGDYSGITAVEYTRIEEQSVIANAVLAGEMDMAQMTMQDQLDRFNDHPDFTVATFALDGLFYLGFNMRSELMSQIEVRQAISQGIDLNLVRQITGEATPAHMPMPSSMPVYNEALNDEAVQYDLAAAQALLAEVGISPSNRQPITLMITPSNVVAATMIQQQLGLLGFDVTIDIEGFGTAMRRAAVGDYDLAISGVFVTDANDLAGMFGSGGYANMIGYSNPDLDALFVAGRSVYEASERMPAYDAVQRFIMAEALILPLWEPNGYMVMSNRVQGFNRVGSMFDVSGVSIAGS